MRETKHAVRFVAGAVALAASACSNGGPANVTMDVGGETAPLPDIGVETQPELSFDILRDQDVSVVPERGALFWPCTSNADCLSGYCVETLTGFECTTQCTEDCPEGWECTQADRTPDPVYLCLPLFGTLCRPCATDVECRQGTSKPAWCLDYAGQGYYCAQKCALDGFCPDGYTCKETALGDGTLEPVCVKSDSECGCPSKYKGMTISTSCYVANEVGTCSGARSCIEGELSPCDAAQPADETCNGLDDDCDSLFDEELGGAECAVENDHGKCPGTVVCQNGAETCVGPEALPETCNGIDDDCDQLVDEESLDTDQDGVADCLDEDDDDDGAVDAGDNCPLVPNPGQKDSDGDGVGDDCDSDKDGDLDPDAADCAPLDPTVGHTVPEKCNGTDDDCDGLVDEQFADLDADAVADCVDGDDDNDGAPDDADNCPVTANPSQTDQDADGIGDACEDDKDGDLDPDATDCAAQDPAVHHGADELCNAIDDNCNGIVDEGFGDADKDGVPDCVDEDDDNDTVKDADDNCPNAANTDQIDSDSDGAGNACDVDDDQDGDPDGLDCKPLDPTVHHKALEVCNDKDDDCDDVVDEQGADGCQTYYYNADDDGYGLEISSKCLCSPQPPYSAAEPGDCDDSNPAIHFGANEWCNGKDDDCDTLTDPAGSLGCAELYEDNDLDGYGAGNAKCLCGNPKGYSAVAGDCDDADALSKPGGIEQCDGKDNDCDGSQDEEGALGCATYFQDKDADGYGVVGTAKCLCQQWGAQLAGDCDDTNGSVFPSAQELCNGTDDNCNGQVDEGTKTTFYKDNDADGYGTPNDKLDACAAPEGYVGSGTDCNDFNPGIHPNEAEACDEVDNDCDGQVDDGLPLKTIYKDNDGDGLAASQAVPVTKCNVPMGYTETKDVTGDGKSDWDCDDSDATVHPGGTELCDGKDNDCNGFKDTSCPTVCPGWPVHLGPGNVQCSLAAVDLDNDTQKEIVVGCESVALSLDGQTLLELPKCDTWPRGVNIAQLDSGSDFTWDVICKNKVFDMSGLRADLTTNPYNTPAVGDVTGDGIPDVVTGSWGSKYYVNVGQWDNSGKWSKKATHDLVLTSVGVDKALYAPTLVDFNGDGVQEVISGSGYMSAAEGDYPDGRVYSWTWNSQTAAFSRYCPLNPALPDTCFATGQSYWWTYSSAALDFDSDGEVEVAMPPNGTWMFDGQGNVLGSGYNGLPADWDLNGQWEWQSSYDRVVGDFDADGALEYFVGNQLREMSGAALPGWPVSQHGPGVLTGIVDDLDGDGRLEYVFPDNQYVACFSLGEGSADRESTLWYGTSFYFNPLHQNGQYDNMEPNDNAAHAPILAGMRGDLSAFIWKSGDVDYYRVPIFGKWTGYKITVKGIAVGKDFDLQVTNSNDAAVVYCTSAKNGNAAEACSVSNSVPNKAGYFVIQVKGKAATDYDAVRPYLLSWEKNNY